MTEFHTYGLDYEDALNKKECYRKKIFSIFHRFYVEFSQEMQIAFLKFINLHKYIFT